MTGEGSESTVTIVDKKDICIWQDDQIYSIASGFVLSWFKEQKEFVGRVKEDINDACSSSCQVDIIEQTAQRDIFSLSLTLLLVASWNSYSLSPSPFPSFPYSCSLSLCPPLNVFFVPPHAKDRKRGRATLRSRKPAIKIKSLDG